MVQYIRSSSICIFLHLWIRYCGGSIGGNDCDKRIVGYFTSWGQRPFTQSQAAQLTHVVFAFAEMKEDGSVVLGDVRPENRFRFRDGVLAKTRLDQLLEVARAEGNEHLRVMFAVGGWENSDHFSSMAANKEKRQVFIDSVLSMLSEFQFDGIDIDWEYPVIGGKVEGLKADKENYVSLMKELRAALDGHQEQTDRSEKYLLTFAGAAGQWTLDPGFDLPGLLEVVDWANVMTYDYFGAWASEWGAYTGPPAPLFFGMPPRFSGKMNVDWTMKYYACQSKQPHKLNLGVPFYGRFWENVGEAAEKKDPMWRIARSKNGSFVGGVTPWRAIENKWSLNATVFHEKSKTPYIWDPARDMFLGFENPESIRHKMNYVKEKNIGGVMLWAIDLDDDSDTLLNTVVAGNLCGSASRDKNELIYRCSPISKKRWWTWDDDQRKAGMCGRSAPLYEGYYSVCDPDDPGFSCCGKFGSCGSGPSYCDCEECINYAADPSKITDEPIRPTVPIQWYTNDAADGLRGRCGRTIAKLNGKYPICNPDDPLAHCCSNGGYCGNSDAHCKCDGCVDFRLIPRFEFQPVRWWTGDGSGQCGPKAPRLPSGDIATCNPESKFSCCSLFGYCGTGPEFCNCDGCVNFKENPDYVYPAQSDEE